MSQDDAVASQSKNRFLLYVLIHMPLILSFFSQEPDLLLVGFSVAGVLYIIAYSIKQGMLYDVLGRLIITLILAGIAAIFPLLGILLILWLVANIIETLAAIKMLFPLFLKFNLPLGLLIGVCMVMKGWLVILPVLAYFWVAKIYIENHVPVDASLEEGIFQIFVMFCSGLLITLSILAIAVALKNLFNISSQLVSRRIPTIQNVAGHMRGNIAVQGYTRTVTSTVTQVVSSVTPGSGALTASALGAAAAQLSASDKSSSSTSALAITQDTPQGLPLLTLSKETRFDPYTGLKNVLLLDSPPDNVPYREIQHVRISKKKKSLFHPAPTLTEVEEALVDAGRALEADAIVNLQYKSGTDWTSGKYIDAEGMAIQLL
ncbi:hypothetical protein [Rivihabitans pingtungensis]|uniref:hypothetical protein n=1 Tax=Rivihabitans pingtungensis TaxID=1054498 RepID=UPI0023F2572B|nr:hypothetical protein [Rivihabitans pingtungensis]